MQAIQFSAAALATMKKADKEKTSEEVAGRVSLAVR
jgi:hypothetical protein